MLLESKKKKKEQKGKYFTVLRAVDGSRKDAEK